MKLINLSILGLDLATAIIKKREENSVGCSSVRRCDTLLHMGMADLRESNLFIDVRCFRAFFVCVFVTERAKKQKRKQSRKQKRTIRKNCEYLSEVLRNT